MATTGRGAWSKIGMPANGSQYYQLLSPVQVGAQPTLGPDYQAVSFGVRAIQRRINGLGFLPHLTEDGHFGQRTDEGLRFAQAKVRVTADGQFGPKTSVAFFWPVVKQVAGAYAHTVGGISQHESGWDVGAVGFSTPDDHGLVQINRPANLNISLAQAFDPRFAFTYCANRITAAFNTYHNLDIAICEYASPLWAKQWFEMGHPPNDAMRDFVAYVQAWKSPA